MNYYLENTEQVLWELNTSEQGLSSKEAAQRLQKNGKNLLKQEEKRSTWRKFLDSITDPMILMLLGAALVQVVATILETRGNFPRRAGRKCDLREERRSGRGGHRPL